MLRKRPLRSRTVNAVLREAVLEGEEAMKIMVSACLLGQNCKYNGGNNYNEELKEFLKGHEVIPVCPEVLGGLPTPRVPSEIVDGIVTDRNGRVVDRQFRAGAEAALKTAQDEGIDLAILQPRSPSCGIGTIYDGTFTGTLVPGNGVFARMLTDNGYKVVTPTDVMSK